LIDVPLDSGAWRWDPAPPVFAEHRGRACVRLASDLSGLLATLPDVALADGVVEADLLVGPERKFPGVVWRVEDEENFESFFVRPHQVGNPDAIQYTPVFNGVSGWQLYHGEGFGAQIEFPLDGWFTVRVVFSGSRAQAYVADLERPALQIRELKRTPAAGGVGLLAGGPAVHVARFAYDTAAPVLEPLDGPMPAQGVIRTWLVSDAFPESELAPTPILEGRAWTPLASEPIGLADLARINGIHDGRNTVYARAVIRSRTAQTKELVFGFSDRVVVFANGRRLYAGDYTYRSRDYRFLGTIGWFDRVYVPLEAGENELVFAVSEDFGGWGVQARFPDAAGLDGDALA